MGWPMTCIGEVASLERKSLLPEEIETGTSYLGLEHVESGGRILGYQTVGAGELQSNKFMFDPGTLLYGKLRPYLAKICIPDREGCCSTDILPLRPLSSPTLQSILRKRFSAGPKVFAWVSAVSYLVRSSNHESHRSQAPPDPGLRLPVHHSDLSAHLLVDAEGMRPALGKHFTYRCLRGNRCAFHRLGGEHQ